MLTVGAAWCCVGIFLSSIAATMFTLKFRTKMRVEIYFSFYDSRFNFTTLCCRMTLIWIIEGQGPTVLAVGAGWGCSDICFLSSIAATMFTLKFRTKMRVEV